MDQQEFHKKLEAARELGLTVKETYVKVGEDYFQKFVVKKGNTIIKSKSFPIDKDDILKNLEGYRDNFTNTANEMQAKIDQIKALDPEPEPGPSP